MMASSTSSFVNSGTGIVLRSANFRGKKLDFRGRPIFKVQDAANNFFNAILKRKIVTEEETDPSCKQYYTEPEDSLITKFEHDVEIDFLHEVKKCRKSVHHKEFFPITEFSIEKLPDDYQDFTLVETIKLLAELTVQITVNGFGKSKRGSGKVIDIIENISDENCPCENCKLKPKASKTWWNIIILTSTYVIGDKEEAKLAKGRLFFRSSQSSLVSVDGVKFQKSTSFEVCRLVCVTCDPDLAKRLDTLLDEFTVVYEKTFDKFWNSKKKDKLVVIVSHPHGFPQMVSIGRSGKIVQTGEDNILTYTNIMCPGSTGAFLYII